MSSQDQNFLTRIEFEQNLPMPKIWLCLLVCIYVCLWYATYSEDVLLTSKVPNYNVGNGCVLPPTHSPTHTQKKLNEKDSGSIDAWVQNTLFLMFLWMYLFTFRGMFTWPASETTGPAWCAARTILQLGPSVWARIRRSLQALSLHATTMRSPVVHRKVQWSFSVYDSALPLGRWHTLWWRTGLWPRCLLWKTSPKCESKIRHSSSSVLDINIYLDCSVIRNSF